MKKAQGISINVIIIAAIALIVLVVLIAIFTGRMSIFGIGLDKNMQGQTCEGTWTQEKCPAEKEIFGNFIRCDSGVKPSSASVATNCYAPGYHCCAS